MSTFDERYDLVVGHFKFQNETPEAIIQIAQKWRDGGEGHRFERLHVFECDRNDRDTWVFLSFEYKLSGGHLALQSLKFWHQHNDEVVQRFGKNLHSWNVSSNVFVI
jgi:hypothetical protein